MPPQLWTQGASINWRPSFRFYEARTKFLSRLDEKGLVRAWRMEDEEVSVRLGDREHEAFLTPTGVRVFATTTEPDLERLILAAELAVKETNIPRLTIVRVYFQHLYPIEGKYDEIRSRSAHLLLGSFADDLKVSDYALLVDGRPDDPTYAFQVEFGIVSRVEIPLRLARLIGRMRGEEDQQRSLPRQLRLADLPEVALFADSSWALVKAPASDEISGALRELWGSGVREASALVERIRSTVTDGQ